MKEHAKNIHYSIEETKNGGRVRIQTSDHAALDAIHSFLRFQITEHKTGDPLNSHPKKQRARAATRDTSPLPNFLLRCQFPPIT